MLSIIYFVTEAIVCLSSLNVYSWAALGPGTLSFFLFYSNGIDRGLEQDRHSEGKYQIAKKLSVL